MKSLQVHELQKDMVVASDIITQHGQLIAQRGSVLTDALITKLGFYGIDRVNIEELTPDMLTTAVAPAPVPVATSTVSAEELAQRDAAHYSARIKKSDSFKAFKDVYLKNLALLEATYENIVQEEYDKVDLNSLLHECTDLFQSKTTLDLFNIIHALDVEDSLYTCNLNVGLISRGIGRWLKFPKESLDLVTLAGLLHDIGKLMIPPSIMEKKGKLTDSEFETVRRHSMYGRKLLKDLPGIDQHIINAALQHHERYDGSGYPNKLAGNDIDPIAAIVAIADVYDAMTALRPHRKPLSPFQVIENFEDEGLQKYNPKYILTFLERLASAYQNRMVVLNDGRKCRIIYLNKGRLSRPIVEFEDKSTIDLSRSLDLHIAEII